MTSATLNGAADSDTGIDQALAASGGNGDARLTNISSRNLVGRGGATLTAGFVLTGDQPVRLLIRGVGPSLAVFGVTDALSDPVLTLRRSDGSVVDLNDDWKTKKFWQRTFIA